MFMFFLFPLFLALLYLYFHNLSPGSKKQNKQKTLRNRKQTEYIYDFKLEKKVYLFHLNDMGNQGFFNLCILLYRNWNALDFKTYYLRIFALLVRSIFNSFLSQIENFQYLKQINKQELKDPVFIIGHFRSGTTLMHNLLSLDTDKFIYPTTLHSAFPTSFLLMEKMTFLLKDLIPKKRPMDNMKLDFSKPQEEEIVIRNLSTFSSLLHIPFMPNEEKFRCFYSFENKKAERKQWINSFIFFLKKVTFFYTKKDGKAKNKRLCLKSPTNTAKAKMLTKLFPNAKFIYLHRHPYDVFRSMVYMVEVCYVHSFLSTPTNKQIQECILSQYEVLYGEYRKAKESGILNAENHIEVKFADFTQDPVSTIKRVYAELDLGNFKRVEERLKNEAQGLRKYKRNSFKPLDPEMKEIIYNRWKPAFEEFGYLK
eukprot:maker-scaffold_2-snap-gene-7.17-mRNA-1 protein AED:0.24 eAED:0.24 QI:199/1/1/1/1/1/2/147/424